MAEHIFNFEAPFTFEGETHTQLELDGLSQLTGNDLVRAQKQLPLANIAQVPVEEDIEFWVWLFSQSLGRPLEFFENLPDTEWRRLHAAAARTLLEFGDVPEELPGERFTAKNMAKVQKQVSFRENLLRFPANNLHYCMACYATLTGVGVEDLLQRRAGTGMMVFMMVRNHFFGWDRTPGKTSPDSSGSAASD